ncbi:hypothetical protein F511_02623 [Dorcoceras hygrometricum]|uniref:Small ribosomal subunit protein uS15c n=1 Tax=Dorcoceras hygrometricum TaxID=472368 RepID=A0A2Z7AMB9_9LAMI|nr:hypothetical protein F511_02623 [Dorcoceras hygrometricum]
MAEITKRLLRLHHDPKPLLRSRVYPIHRHFSTSSDPPPEPEADPERRSSYFNDVKDSLRGGSPPHVRPQMQHKPLSFSKPTPLRPPPSKTTSFEEISRNLSEFRRRSVVPPPSSSLSSEKLPSLQELYMKKISSQTDSSGSSIPSKYMSPASGGKVSFDAIRDSLKKLRTNTMSQRRPDDSSGKPVDPMSLRRFTESLKLKPGEMNASQLIIGGSDALPASLLGKDKNDGGGKHNVAFVRTYSDEEMGKKLASLRPEKKGKWFSLQELNDRLAKMRVLEEKEIAARGFSFHLKELKESLVTIKLNSEQKAKRDMHKHYVFSLGGTPSYMLQPPKDHLVEKYFHPDHMSSAEKLKLELEKVRGEFKMSESDCGSARVQVAQLTTKIKHLSTVLHKKDKHSRKGLKEMVQRRKKLLRYLRKTDWDSYTLVLSKLGLRDNPDMKA